MSMNHWKIYEPIDGVATFDTNTAGPTLADLQVTANMHASDAYPDTRIGVVIAGLGSLALTLDHSAALRACLERAERDVRRGGPAPTAATGTEGLCESCSQPIRAGELVYRHGNVTIHAGPCPTEERGDGGATA